MESLPIFCCCAAIFMVLFIDCSSSYLLHPLISNSTLEHANFTKISDDFRVVNRRVLSKCPDPNPFLQVNVFGSNSKPLLDEQYVNVTISGVLFPMEHDWVAMITPSTSDVGYCPLKKAEYVQTGDLADLPLLCHYPVKAQYVKNDPDYLSCKKKKCEKFADGKCVITTCNATLTFHVINFRTNISFVLFAGGFDTPCTLATSKQPLAFANPNKPLYGHLSSVDSTASSMKLRWVSGDQKPQQVQYGDGKTQTSQVTTFSPNDMCSCEFHTPLCQLYQVLLKISGGTIQDIYVHSALMTELKPSTTFTYRYGSDSVGWSDKTQFRTPPAGAGAVSDEVRFLAFGDMGKAPLDASVEHYIQPGSLSVVKAMTDEVNSSNVDSIFHIGDISYATGFLVEWDYFLQLITPLASQVSYMTAIGNHERDYIKSGSVYITPDSGGECGVPYEKYFPMPTQDKDKPWYSIEQASVHFTVISTEHDWTLNSQQYKWMKQDMGSVDRSKTPWLVFMGHRPMYSSNGGASVDTKFVSSVEPLLLQNKVDLVLFGHVHNYERTCSVYNSQCVSMPRKDENGVDQYDHNNYTAPVHVVIGMAGFSLDKSPDQADEWSLVRISEFGYLRAHATKQQLKLEFVSSATKKVEDSFSLTKKIQ